MAIAYRAGSNASNFGSPLTISKPTGVIDNDVMVAVVQSASAPTPPSGWTQQVANSSPAGRQVYVFTKVAVSEGTSYDFIVGAFDNYATIDAYTGVDNGTPMDVTPGVNSGVVDPIAYPDITPVTDKAWHIPGESGANAQTTSTPTNYTPRQASSNLLFNFSRLITPPGAITGLQSTGGGGDWASFSAVLRPLPDVPVAVRGRRWRILGTH